MDKNYVSLTDNELLARLKKYGLPHGPLVGTTRKLYEKKIYEYEKTLGQQQPLSRSSAVRTSSIVDKSKLQMTDDEICALLKKYGLEHGPVVASTRKLYEKKIHEYENKLKQQGSVVGVPTAESSEKKLAKPRSKSSVKVSCPTSTHISTYTDSSTIQYITPEAYGNSGTIENYSSQQAGPVQVKTPRRGKSLLPKSTDGSQYTWQELMEMRDYLLIMEAEVQPPSSQPLAPAMRSHSTQWAGHLASDSAGPHRQQQNPDHPMLDLGERVTQTTVQDSHFEKPLLLETREPGRLRKIS